MAPSPDSTAFAGQDFLRPPEVSAEGQTRRFLLSTYDIAAYRDADYAHFGLEIPAFLARAVPKRRAEFLAGRVLAGQALARLGGTGVVARGEKGEPLWPAGFRGSISHSHGTVGVWLGRGGAHLGLDIEARAGARAARAIIANVLTGSERARLGADPDALRATALFSAKEALYKALFPHVGRFFGFDHAELHDWRPAGLILRLTRPLAPDLPAGALFDIAQLWRADSIIISRCEIET